MVHEEVEEEGMPQTQGQVEFHASLGYRIRHWGLGWKGWGKVLHIYIYIYRIISKNFTHSHMYLYLMVKHSLKLKNRTDDKPLLINPSGETF